ncbi:MAG: pyruvate kinase [Acidimicrobiales bacterium]|nr:pyruvate kinase [Acidimicrobiales bacterium]MCB9373699.1 pyruvate kinase [Microthrixaceae bacterium]
MARRTKIVATIGPASESPTVMQRMVEAGMDVARLGLAHDTLDLQIERYFRLRAAAEAAGRPLGILVDLPGPKVRAGSFPDGGLDLAEGQHLRLTPGTGHSTAEVVEVDYEGLLDDVQVGDSLMFGDGSVVVAVRDRDGDGLAVEVDHGGHLEGRPGVHVPSDRLRVPTPTSADLRMLDAFVDVGVDMVAVSFVRSAHDVRRVGTEPHPRGPLVIAKVETRAAVENLEGIVAASGAIMVARGDLGAEFPIEELPHLQKRIIRKCIALGRPVITATQMLESMIHAATPTRAEASDVANAVFDGSSAVMLSGETAIGHDPVGTVRTMARIAGRADQEFDYSGWAPQLSQLNVVTPGAGDAQVTDAMTMAAWRAATEARASAILCLSRTGFTVRVIARFRPQTKILGFSTDERTVRQLTLSWGATPIALPERGGETHTQIEAAIEIARARGEIRSGDTVAVLAGTHGGSTATDQLRLVHVP